jgi:octaprenyl-diphosphate synthase
MSGVATANNFRSPVTAERFFARAAPFLERLDRFLTSQKDEFEVELRDLVEYALEHSGKRLRPIALFLAGADRDGNSNEEMVRAAAVVELVHLATLVHDDILDEAEVRHKKETVSRKFGVSAAVLLGDALFAQALQLASGFRTTEVCRLVSEATRMICAGEIEQTLNGHFGGDEIERYFRIIGRKTAVLFEVSCRLGALLGDPGAEKASVAGDFGRHIGLAYQIYDDLVDVLGSESIIGKTLGTDVASGKKTLPLVLLAEKLRTGPRDDQSARMDLASHSDFSEVERMIRSDGIVEQVSRFFDSEIKKAQAAAVSLSQKGSGDGLLDLAFFVGDRFSSLVHRGE